MECYEKPTPFECLMHYGVKGMKWGVRRTPEELARAREGVEKTDKAGIIKTTISGHSSTPKQAAPNSIVDHVGKDGKIDVRTFYDSKGRKAVDIHTTDHGHPKQHDEIPHAHEYQWNDDMSSSERTTRPLTDKERRENEDIL